MPTNFAEYFRQRAELRTAFPTLTPDRLLFIGEFFKPPFNWRHDAEYFVIWLLHAMLLAPLSESGPSNTRDYNGYVLPPHINATEFYNAFSADLQTLMSRANAVAERLEQDFICANCVMMAVGELAGQFRTHNMGLWTPNTSADNIPDSPLF